MKTNLHGRHEGLLPQGLAKDPGIADLQYLHEGEDTRHGARLEEYRPSLNPSGIAGAQ